MKSFFLTLGILILTFCTHSKANPIFSAEDLASIATQASDNINEKLSSLSTEDKIKEAKTFYNKEEIDLSEESLIASYRAELILKESIQLLDQKYPGRILKDAHWIWNNVGGVYARMKIVYCSSEEYIALWGTQHSQQGYSGFYKALDVYDIMLTGKKSGYYADEKTSLPFINQTPGEYSVLHKRTSRYYNMDAFTYMIDYGVGKPSKAFYQGIIAPFIFINHDAESLKYQLSDCLRSRKQNRKLD